MDGAGKPIAKGAAVGLRIAADKNSVAMQVEEYKMRN